MDEAKRGLLIGVLAALTCEILFGLSYSFTKSVMGVADEIDLLGWRFVVAAATILLLRAFRVVRTNLRGKDLRPLLVISGLNPILYFLGETFGIARTSASESGMFLACIPVVSIAASSLMLGKRPSRRQVVGIVITLVGVLIAVLASGLELSFSASGYAILALAVLSYSLYTVYVERARGFTGVEITLVMLVTGAFFFFTLFLAKNLWAGALASSLMLPLSSSAFLVAVLYQGIGCSMLAFFAANTAIRHLGVNTTSSFIGVSAVVAILAGVLVLGEPLTLLQVVGTGLILLGVYAANASFALPRARRPRRPARMRRAR